MRSADDGGLISTNVFHTLKDLTSIPQYTVLVSLLDLWLQKLVLKSITSLLFYSSVWAARFWHC